ncbi:MAG: type I DNA topoisomerase [Patescibacteria group bacterium]|nr:type I DNA topoisomerase [Patescibacteria group bacterium]
MNLVIVESPTKAKTIAKFLGKEYKIESSFGHIRDLPKSKIGIDTEKNFEPEYIIPTRARKNVNQLKKLAKKAENIILATDEDREGEAIAWHLLSALKLKENQTGRIVFHEITKPAIKEALKNPRALDMKLVDAQQARRILDRLVGYKLSPFLWKKVARGLSAGRVQSVAVRLIVEKEREIKAFKADEYWNIDALLSRLDDMPVSEEQAEKIITAKLNKIDNKVLKKLDIKNNKAADKIVADLKNAKYVVADIKKKEIRKNPPKPFTTSTLQQTANSMLGFSAKQTMVVAQQLYEQGFITYMRTDSFFMADKFLNDAHNYIKKELGEKYALSSPRKFKTKVKGAQEAHEAVRPTEAANTPEKLKKLNSTQKRLYRLIWQRSIATQMPEAVFDSTILDVDAVDSPYQFRANGQIKKFDGFLKIYPDNSKELELPRVKAKETLELHRLNKEQHFTKPPARYSDASLVKILEKHGIGRPSTYAPTISTIIARNYVNRDDNKRLFPTDIAFVVNDILISHFSDIVNFEFTAKIETDFDKIADGKINWQEVIKNFYDPFEKNLEKKYNELNKEDIMPEEKSNEKCDKCGETMIIKTGRYGKFLACSGFPDCKNIKSMGKDGKADKKTKELEKKYKDEKCDKCGEAMIIKNGRFGPFLACSGYPKCKNIKSIKENSGSTGIKCPKCEKGEIVQKRSKRGVFYACDAYPDCKNAYWGKPTGKKCPDCGALLIEVKDGVKCSAKGCGYTS